MTDSEADEIARTFLQHFGDKLTEWEEGFLLSIRQRVSARKPLTDTQRVKVDDVATRAQQRHEPPEGELPERRLDERPLHSHDWIDGTCRICQARQTIRRTR